MQPLRPTFAEIAESAALVVTRRSLGSGPERQDLPPSPRRSEARCLLQASAPIRRAAAEELSALRETGDSIPPPNGPHAECKRAENTTEMRDAPPAMERRAAAKSRPNKTVEGEINRQPRQAMNGTCNGKLNINS